MKLTGCKAFLMLQSDIYDWDLMMQRFSVKCSTTVAMIFIKVLQLLMLVVRRVSIHNQDNDSWTEILKACSCPFMPPKATTKSPCAQTRTTPSRLWPGQSCLRLKISEMLQLSTVLSPPLYMDKETESQADWSHGKQIDEPGFKSRQVELQRAALSGLSHPELILYSMMIWSEYYSLLPLKNGRKVF